jgi:hypothetical protein
MDARGALRLAAMAIIHYNSQRKWAVLGGR